MTTTSLKTAPAAVLFSLVSLACAQSTPELEAQLARGKSAYAVCAACHGPDGKGLPTTPPMAPSFIGSKLANAAPEVPVALVLKGIQKLDTKYLATMAPLGATMTDDQVADALTYIRKSWGNSAAAISSAEVKEIRQKYSSITAPLPRSGYEKKAEKLAEAASGAGEAKKPEESK